MSMCCDGWSNVVGGSRTRCIGEYRHRHPRATAARSITSSIHSNFSSYSQAFCAEGIINKRLLANKNYERLAEELGDNQPLLLLKLAGLEADGVTNSKPHPDEPDISENLRPWSKDQMTSTPAVDAKKRAYAKPESPEYKGRQNLAHPTPAPVGQAPPAVIPQVHQIPQITIYNNTTPTQRLPVQQSAYFMPPNPSHPPYTGSFSSLLITGSTIPFTTSFSSPFATKFYVPPATSFSPPLATSSFTPSPLRSHQPPPQKRQRLSSPNIPGEAIGGNIRSDRRTENKSQAGTASINVSIQVLVLSYSICIY